VIVTSDSLQLFINKCLHTGQTEYPTKISESVQGQLKRIKWKWLGHTLRTQDHAETWRPRNTWKMDLVKEMGQWASCTAGERRRPQRTTELDGDEWSVIYAPLAVTRRKSSEWQWLMYVSHFHYNKGTRLLELSGNQVMKNYDDMFSHSVWDHGWDRQ